MSLAWARTRCCSALAVAVVLPLLGCGGVEDPFERADVTGTVNLDGAPVKYGEIYFRGAEPNEKSEIAQATMRIREGTFKSNPAALPGLGENTVLISIYEGNPPPPPDPDDESGDAPPEPTLVGYYSTEVDVGGEGELKFDIKQADLTKTPPNE